MAKAKKTTRAKASRKSVKTVSKNALRAPVDNKLSIALIILALIVFVLAAVAMGR